MIEAIGTLFSHWMLPLLMVGLLGFGYVRGVRVYEVFCEGAKEGFQTAIRIIPYLVAIMVAVGMFRAAGALTLIGQVLSPVLVPLGIPEEALAMGLIRPLSGSGAFGLLGETVKAHGPDAYVTKMVATIQGSTETTFYVMAVYFGAVGVTKVRWAIAAGLTADFVGFVAAVAICRVMFAGG